MLKKLIDEVEDNYNNLPLSYFNYYFGNNFLPKIKSIQYELNYICNEQADSLQEAQLKDRIKELL